MSLSYAFCGIYKESALASCHGTAARCPLFGSSRCARARGRARKRLAPGAVRRRGRMGDRGPVPDRPGRPGTDRPRRAVAGPKRPRSGHLLRQRDELPARPGALRTGCRRGRLSLLQLRRQAAWSGRAAAGSDGAAVAGGTGRKPPAALPRRPGERPDRAGRSDQPPAGPGRTASGHGAPGSRRSCRHARRDPGGRDDGTPVRRLRLPGRRRRTGTRRAGGNRRDTPPQQPRRDPRHRRSGRHRLAALLPARRVDAGASGRRGWRRRCRPARRRVLQWPVSRD